jgi:hypothetical protein
MMPPIVLDAWDPDAVAAATGDVWVAARAMPIPPPSAWCARIVPMTVGSETPEDAVDTARLIAEVVGHRRVVVVVAVDGRRDGDAEAEVTRALLAEGFSVQNANSSAS